MEKFLLKDKLPLLETEKDLIKKTNNLLKIAMECNNVMDTQSIITDAILQLIETNKKLSWQVESFVANFCQKH